MLVNPCEGAKAQKLCLLVSSRRRGGDEASPWLVEASAVADAYLRPCRMCPRLCPCTLERADLFVYSLPIR